VKGRSQKKPKSVEERESPPPRPLLGEETGLLSDNEQHSLRNGERGVVMAKGRREGEKGRSPVLFMSGLDSSCGSVWVAFYQRKGKGRAAGRLVFLQREWAQKRECGGEEGKSDGGSGGRTRK